MYSVRDFKDLCTFNDNTDPLINESNIHSMYYYCYLLFYLPESTDSRYSISHQYYYCYLLFYLPESTDSRYSISHQYYYCYLLFYLPSVLLLLFIILSPRKY